MSLKESIRNKIMDDMIKKVNPVGQFKVLLTDPHSLKIVNATCNAADMTSENVAVIENLYNKRNPFVDYDAIYFVDPTEKSIKHIIDDFKAKPPYKNVHIFLTSALSDGLFAKIKKFNPLFQHVRTCTELNIDFVAVESQVFDLSRPDSINVIHSASTPSHLHLEIKEMSKQLCSVLGTIGQHPTIRYFHPLSASGRRVSDPATGKLAFQVAADLTDLTHDEKFPRSPNGSSLLILDRSIDVFAPLLHESSYQSMISDLLGFQDGNKVEWNGEGSNNGVILLDETDPVWCDIRHMHIAEASEYLVQGVKNFASSNKAAQWNSKDANSNSLAKISQIQETLSALPEYQLKKAKFALHSDICTKIMQLYNEKGLNKIIELEQEFATGETNSGKSLKNKFNALMKMLNDNSIGKHEKMRLAIAYFVSANGLSTQETDNILKHSGLALSKIEEKAFYNLDLLGVKLSASYEASKNVNSSSFAHVNRKGVGLSKNFGDKFDNCRYITALKYIIMDFIKNNLKNEDFPLIAATSSPSITSSSSRSDITSIQSIKTKPSWATSRSTKSNSSIKTPTDFRVKGPKLIIFIIGGTTTSEMRSIYEITKEFGTDILLGSTHIYSPASFMDTLKFLHLGTPPTGMERLLLDPPPKVRRGSRSGNGLRGDPVEGRMKSMNIDGGSPTRCVLPGSSNPPRTASSGRGGSPSRTKSSPTRNSGRRHVSPLRVNSASSSGSISSKMEDAARQQSRQVEYRRQRSPVGSNRGPLRSSRSRKEEEDRIKKEEVQARKKEEEGKKGKGWFGMW